MNISGRRWSFELLWGPVGMELRDSANCNSTLLRTNSIPWKTNWKVTVNWHQLAPVKHCLRILKWNEKLFIPKSTISLRKLSPPYFFSPKKRENPAALKYVDWASKEINSFIFERLHDLLSKYEKKFYKWC